MTFADVARHFSVDEFASHDGCDYPYEWVNERLPVLVSLLEKIRSHFDSRIHVVSGYRTPAWNAHVGGEPGSQHLQGRAADIIVMGVPADRVHAEVLALYEAGQLPELGGLGSYPGFTHVDVRRGDHLAQWTGTRTAKATVGG